MCCCCRCFAAVVVVVVVAAAVAVAVVVAVAVAVAVAVHGWTVYDTGTQPINQLNNPVRRKQAKLGQFSISIFNLFNPELDHNSLSKLPA